MEKEKTEIEKPVDELINPKCVRCKNFVLNMRIDHLQDALNKLGIECPLVDKIADFKKVEKDG